MQLCQWPGQGGRIQRNSSLLMKQIQLLYLQEVENIPLLPTYLFPFCMFQFKFKKKKEGGCFLYYSLVRSRGLRYIFCNRKNSLYQKQCQEKIKVRIKGNILPKITSQSKVLRVSLELQYFLKLTVFKGAVMVPLIPLEWTGSVMTLPEYCSDGDCGHQESGLLINLISSVEGI